MRYTVTDSSGAIVGEGHFDGENMALGLSSVLFKCPSCGQSRFVDGGDNWTCENCAITYTFYDDESETTGYLH